MKLDPPATVPGMFPLILLMDMVALCSVLADFGNISTDPLALRPGSAESTRVIIPVFNAWHGSQCLLVWEFPEP